MTKRREEVCLHYMGFGLCAKGLNASDKGSCSRCAHYAASGRGQSLRDEDYMESCSSCAELIGHGAKAGSTGLRARA